MRLEKTKENVVKIYFDLEDLTENNIDLNSFLTNSENSKHFINAITEIAKEDFNLNINNFNINILSFCNQNFILLLSPNNISDHIFSICNFKNSLTEQNTYSFLLYRFDSYKELHSFCIYLKKSIPLKTASTLYSYQNSYYLHLNSDNNLIFQSILSEFKDNIKISDTSFYNFSEVSDILILENAIENII